MSDKVLYPDLSQVKRAFGSNYKCLKFLQYIRWGGSLTRFECPVCGPVKCERVIKEKKRVRYECGICGTRFSVLTHTIFEWSRIPLTKWFFVIYHLTEQNSTWSCREIASIIKVNKLTAMRMKRSIKEPDKENNKIINKIRNNLKDLSSIEKIQFDDNVKFQRKGRTRV